MWRHTTTDTVDINTPKNFVSWSDTSEDMWIVQGREEGTIQSNTFANFKICIMLILSNILKETLDMVKMEQLYGVVFTMKTVLKALLIPCV